MLASSILKNLLNDIVDVANLLYNILNNLFLNNNSNSMEPKIKVSKHMPDVFLHSRSAIPKDREKKHVEKLTESEKPV